ncbi:MAG TPA: hypothetical protein VGN55_21555 [Xanthobacteraceae bacterium]|jgi:hypothetical protein
MQNAPPNAAPQAPLPIETETDAKSAIVGLTAVMDGLEAVVTEETELVRAGHLRKATGLGAKKTELCSLYFKAVERLKANRKLLLRLVPQDVSALARRHELLQGVLKTNLVVLATAHAVSEGIMRRLSGDLDRKACPQVYGASGRAMAPDPKRAQPLAFSRML